MECRGLFYTVFTFAVLTIAIFDGRVKGNVFKRFNFPEDILGPESTMMDVWEDHAENVKPPHDCFKNLSQYLMQEYIVTYLVLEQDNNKFSTTGECKQMNEHQLWLISLQVLLKKHFLLRQGETVTNITDNLMNSFNLCGYAKVNRVDCEGVELSLLNDNSLIGVNMALLTKRQHL